MSIYQPYNWKAKLLKGLWLKSKLVWTLFCRKSCPQSIADILRMIDDRQCPGDYIWSADIGERGADKACLLLANTTEPFAYKFVKIGRTENAIRNVQNEAAQLLFLSRHQEINAPKLIKSGRWKNYYFLVTDVFCGTKFNRSTLSDDLLNLLFSLVDSQALMSRKVHGKLDLIYSFSHGDFCPWNLLLEGSVIKTIDWELAGFYPLGYDLFTFVFQTSFLLTPNETLSKPLLQNKPYIEMFFSKYGVVSWWPYLYSFAQLKADASVHDKKLRHHYSALIDYASDKSNYNKLG